LNVELFFGKESEMGKRRNSIFIIAALLALASLWSACSRNAQPPSDEEIIRAIDDSGIMKRADGSIEVVPPVRIAERGERNKDGSWPVKVTFTLTHRMSDGRKSPPMETTALFKISRGKDKAGTSVWVASAP